MINNHELLSGGLEKVSAAAKRLSVDRVTLYRWIQDGKISYLNLNGVYRVPTRAVDELLLQGLHLCSFQQSEQH
jgi:excisionase family DNA binding protein